LVWRGPVIEKFSPIDGKLLARVRTATDAEYDGRSRAHRRHSRNGASRRDRSAGERCASRDALRELKSELGQLVTLESGKIIAEGEGEVQEMIDICDFAVANRECSMD